MALQMLLSVELQHNTLSNENLCINQPLLLHFLHKIKPDFIFLCKNIVSKQKHTIENSFL